MQPAQRNYTRHSKQGTFVSQHWQAQQPYENVKLPLDLARPAVDSHLAHI